MKMKMKRHDQNFSLQYTLCGCTQRVNRVWLFCFLADSIVQLFSLSGEYKVKKQDLTCLAAIKFYPQGNVTLPFLWDDSQIPCFDWWDQVMADNSVAVVISLKCLKKEMSFTNVTQSQLKRSSHSFQMKRDNFSILISSVLKSLGHCVSDFWRYFLLTTSSNCPSCSLLLAKWCPILKEDIL